MRYFRFFIALFLLVLCLAEVTLSAPAPAKPKAGKAPARRPSTPPPPKRPATPPAAAKKTTTKKPATKKQPSTSTSRPVTPPPPQNPATPPGNSRPGSPAQVDVGAEKGCASKKTCADCIKVKGAFGLACGFDNSGKCVGLSTAPLDTLAKNTAECNKLASQSQPAPAAVDPIILQAAQKHFNGISAHVFGTEEGAKPFSGKHRTDVFAAKNPNFTKTEGPGTGLSVFKSNNPNSRNVKTTWDEDVFSTEDIREMSVQAIAAVMEQKVKKGQLKKSDKMKLPKSNAKTSIVVPNPKVKDQNFCITVQGNTSVFPGSINPLAKNIRPGQVCSPEVDASDE